MNHIDDLGSGLGNGSEASQALAIQNFTFENVKSIEEAEISENHSRINTSLDCGWVADFKRIVF